MKEVQRFLIWGKWLLLERDAGKSRRYPYRLRWEGSPQPLEDSLGEAEVFGVLARLLASPDTTTPPIFRLAGSFLNDLSDRLADEYNGTWKGPDWLGDTAREALKLPTYGAPDWLVVRKLARWFHPDVEEEC